MTVWQNRKMFSKFRKKVPWNVLLLFFLAACVASGSDGSTEADEPPTVLAAADVLPTGFSSAVVVTATARPEREEEVPFVTVVLDDEALQSRRQARTLPEALSELPGVMVQKTAHGQGSPFLRGFTGFRTLMLVDGVRLDTSVMREGPNQYWTTVDPYALDKVEVVKGPVSVLYGSHSIGGTVQALTRAPPPPGAPRSSGGLRYRYASAEHSHVGRLDLRGALGAKASYTVGLSGKSFGDLEAGGQTGTQAKTGYDQRDFDAKLRVDLARDRVLTAAFQSTTLDDAWRTHRTIIGVPWRGTSVGSELERKLDQSRDLGYARLESQHGGRFWSAWNATLSLHRQGEDRDRVRADSRRDLQGFDVETVGASIRFEKPTDRAVWSYGAETYRDDVGSFRTDFNVDGTLRGHAIQGPVADDATYQLSGVFVQHQRAVSPSWRVILGGRYTMAEVDAETVADPLTGERLSFSDSLDQTTFSVRFLWSRPESRGQLFGGLSQAFRAPNLSDLTRFDSARSNEIETPSPGLEPERFLAWEVGWRWRSRKLRFEVAAFRVDIEDLIHRVPTGREIDGELEVTKRNGATGVSQGLELSLERVLSRRLRALFSATWLDGEVDTFPSATAPSVREPLDRQPPPSAQLALRWQGKASWLEALLLAVDRADELSSRDLADRQRIPPGGTPGYGVLTVRGGWQAREHLAISVGVENVTDKDYRIHGSGLNEAGRNLVGSVQLAF